MHNKLTPDLIVSLNPYVSAIIDKKIDQGVLLDEKKGRYWHLSSNLLSLVLILAKYPNGQSIEEMAKHLSLYSKDEEEELKKAIQTLLEGKLIKVKNKSKEFRQPSLLLVLNYAIMNLWWRIILQIIGWYPVWKIRLQQAEIYNDLLAENQFSKKGNPPDIIDEIIAAMRLACIFPWVRRDCVPNSLTIYHLLIKMGYSPKLVIGAKVIPCEPHMWVVLDGYRIDSGANDISLDVFNPIGYVAQVDDFIK